MTPIDALIRLLADCSQHVGMGHHSYIVGGAVRDHVLGLDVKDVDVVVEPQDGRDASTLGTEVAKRLGLQCHADQYGVVHIGPVQEPRSKRDYFHQYLGVSLVGQKVEIVTSRKEKYDRSLKKDSHKPSEVAVGTIREDLERRDFTINTLMWPLGDLTNGVEGAEVIDHLGGMADLLLGMTLRTPLDPSETFDDDPSRMLRAVRFALKYNLEIEEGTYRAIKAKASELKRLPYEAIDSLFFDKILSLSTDGSRVRSTLAFMDRLELLAPVREMIPASRQRRAIQERVKDPRPLLVLARYGFHVGVSFTKQQLQHLLEAEERLADDQLALLFQSFKTPFDTKQYMLATGEVPGPAIGRAIERARDLVLLGMSPERVLEVLIGGPS